MTISPGLHLSVPADVYHADPCDRPSLNQSIAKLLIPASSTSRSPLHAWNAHPRLNVHHVDETANRFDLGSTAHALLIGRGRQVEVIDHDDWRTKAAKELRDDARAAGKIPMLRHQYDTATAMVGAARIQIAASEWPNLFSEGNGEVVAIADDGGYFMRAMIDWMMPDHRVCADYKTTEACASPTAVQYRVQGEEWPIQAAMQELILDKIEPQNAGRREFLFVCQEAYEPYAMTIGRIPEATMHIARWKLAMAIGTRKSCLRENAWPGYGMNTVSLEYAPHVAAKVMGEMDAGQ